MPDVLSQTTRRRLMRYGAPYILLAMVAYLCNLGPINRDLDLLELFSGQGELSKAFERHTFAAGQYDICKNWCMDLRTTAGMLRAVQMTLRLKIGGLLWAGTPCSTWVFLARGSTGRSQGHPLGREDTRSVSDANLVVSRVALLILLAVARGASWIVEQPTTSLMPRHPRMMQLQKMSLGLGWLGMLFAIPRTWQVAHSYLSECALQSVCFT